VGRSGSAAWRAPCCGLGDGRSFRRLRVETSKPRLSALPHRRRTPGRWCLQRRPSVRSPIPRAHAMHAQRPFVPWPDCPNNSRHHHGPARGWKPADRKMRVWNVSVDASQGPRAGWRASASSLQAIGSDPDSRASSPAS